MQHPQAKHHTMHSSAFPDYSTRPPAEVVNLSVPAAAPASVARCGPRSEIGRRDLPAGDGSSAYWGLGSVDRRIQHQQMQQMQQIPEQQHQQMQMQKQGVCNARYEITAWTMNCPGSQNDRTAFKHLGFDNLIDTLSDSCFIVGDAAYPPSHRVLVPYPGTAISRSQDAYNFYQSQARISIEQAFGILVPRHFSSVDVAQSKEQQQQQQRGRASASHQHPSASLVPPPSLSPPPVLTAAQQEHLREQQQQQQQQQQWRRSENVGGVDAAVSGLHHHGAGCGGGVQHDKARELALPPSPSRHRIQNRSFQAPVTAAMSLRSSSPQNTVQAQPLATAPPAGLRLQMCGLADAPISAPVTPIMVYAYPHGYMMAYPIAKPPHGQARRQSAHYGQAPKSWNSHDCVSPSRGSTHAGCGRRGKEETRALSPEGSPAASSSTSVLSSESLCQAGRGGNQSQGRSLRASSMVSSVLSDAADRRCSYNEAMQPPASEPTIMDQTGEGENRLLETPSSSHARRSSTRSVGGEPAGRDKENTRAGPGVLGDKKKTDAVPLQAEGQLSGQKRQGRDLELEKQKAFSGSYFQVSPGSFLQSSKRQRHFA